MLDKVNLIFERKLTRKSKVRAVTFNNEARTSGPIAPTNSDTCSLQRKEKSGNIQIRNTVRRTIHNKEKTRGFNLPNRRIKVKVINTISEGVKQVIASTFVETF